MPPKQTDAMILIYSVAVGVISQRVRRYYYINLEGTETQYNMMIYFTMTTTQVRYTVAV